MTFKLIGANLSKSPGKGLFIMNFNNIINKIITYLKEVKVEIKKVNWPTANQTMRYTLIVIGVSVAIAMFLGGLDFLFTTVITKFL